MGVWLTGLVLLTFNVPILLILAVVPFGERLNQALKEKAPDGTASDVTSYSRVTGALGAVVVTSFFWATGNIVLVQALSDVAKIKPMMDAVSPFFLVGSALFLPYAFNQLKTLFPWSANAAVGLAKASQGAVSATIQLDAAPTRLIIANLSNIDDAELNNVLAAISVQVTQHFKREWGVSASLTSQRMTLSGPHVQLDVARDAIIYLGESSQDADSGVNSAKGYHSKNHDCVPYGFVYLDACRIAKECWSVTLSHKILELLADQAINTRVVGPDPSFVGPNAPDVSFELEVCDPVQGDYYPINGVNVANFVNKSYYRKPGGAPETNHMKLYLKPFSARPKGYVQYRDAAGYVQPFYGDDAQPPGREEARALMGDGRRNARRASRPASAGAAPAKATA